MRDTPRTDSDDRPYPSPEHAQRIVFEGCECAVMAPEDYEALYNHARQLERELASAKIGAARYEYLRKIHPSDYSKLYKDCLYQDLNFDAEVDRRGMCHE